jgi:hypothetical protein
MELLSQLITPVASLWVIHNAIFTSAGFVNKMRETVITAVYEKERIGREHQKAIFIDWLLCMCAVLFGLRDICRHRAVDQPDAHEASHPAVGGVWRSQPILRSAPSCSRSARSRTQSSC